jgi:hypothetical protein
MALAQHLGLFGEQIAITWAQQIEAGIARRHQFPGLAPRLARHMGPLHLAPAKKAFRLGQGAKANPLLQVGIPVAVDQTLFAPGRDLVTALAQAFDDAMDLSIYKPRGRWASWRTMAFCSPSTTE